MEAAQFFQPFDWHRIFFGDQAGLWFLLEVVFRTVVMYGYALVFARFIGKRGVGQVSPFEFILIIIISSAAGDPMFYRHVPLLHGIVVLTVVMILHRLVSVVTDRSERAEDVLEGEPVLVVENGRILEQSLGGGTLSRRELMMELRQQGVRNVGELERAFFEPNGKISVLQASEDKQRKTESTQPKDFRPKGTLPSASAPR